MVAFAVGMALLHLADPEAGAPVQPDPDLIIVTGERVERSLRNTSSSVFVATQEDIENQGADRVDQILSLVPNVQLGNGSQGPAIRGMDATGPLYALPAFLGGNRPRTALIVDGRPVTYNEFVFGPAPVWDVQRIEVFRSPQTTTQGQNSIAGAIFVNSNDPGPSTEFRARALIGDYRARQLSLVASGPIVDDDVSLRLTGDLRYNRTTSRIADVMRGADPNHEVYGLIRAKVLATPLPDTRVLVTYVHSQSQAPQIVGVSAPFRGRRDEDVTYGLFRTNVDSLTASLDHRVDDHLTAHLLLSGGDSHARRFAIPDFGETTNHARDWTAEVVVNWKPNERLRIVGGASRNHVDLDQFINLRRLSGSVGRFRDWQDGTGIFADVRLALSSRTAVTAGIRYQRDRQKRLGALTANVFEVPVDFIGTFDAWLPKVTLSHDISSSLTVGAMVQKAYNPGGTTVRVDTFRPDNFKPETLWDYELFARGNLIGNAISFETNLFYYDMRNAQRARTIRVLTPSGMAAGFADLFNVPKARTYGAEGQVRWRVNAALSGSVAVGLLRTKVIKTDAESFRLEDRQFDRSPHFTASASIDWRPIDRLFLSAQLRHHSPYFSDPENSPAMRVGSGTSADARAEYRLRRWSVFAQVRNLFDAFNLVYLDASNSGEAEDPRRFSVGIEGRF